MPEMLDDVQALESITVGIYRTSATVKGGRRFSFGALVVVGDRNGRVGMGYAKANQVPQAIEKAQKEAKRKLLTFPMEGRTIPHVAEGKYGACSVRLVPASPGTGVIAGAAVRAVLEMFGIQDCLTKSFGSTNPKNLIKAVFHGLSKLRTKDDIESLRDVSLAKTTVQEAIERGRAFMPEPKAKPKREPAKSEQGEKRGGGRGRKGGGQGRGGGRGEQRGPREQSAKVAPESTDAQQQAES